MKKNNNMESCGREIIPLENQLCFGLYATSHAIIRAYRPLLAELDLTYPQFLVLLALWEKDGQTVSDLGTILFLDSGTLSPLLKRLEVAQLITKTRLRRDERLVEIHLTDRGESLRRAGEETCNRVRLMTGMSLNEINALRLQLDKLLNALHQPEISDADPKLAQIAR